MRSFGTEDRPTDRPVAPRDEVYEYIIFRGSDIKDIRVCEPPKPQATLQGGLPNDPAIVKVFTLPLLCWLLAKPRLFSTPLPTLEVLWLGRDSVGLVAGLRGVLLSWTTSAPPAQLPPGN